MPLTNHVGLWIRGVVEVKNANQPLFTIFGAKIAPHTSPTEAPAANENAWLNHQRQSVRNSSTYLTGGNWIQKFTTPVILSSITSASCKAVATSPALEDHDYKHYFPKTAPNSPLQMWNQESARWSEKIYWAFYVNVKMWEERVHSPEWRHLSQDTGGVRREVNRRIALWSKQHPW